MFTIFNLSSELYSPPVLNLLKYPAVVHRQRLHLPSWVNFFGLISPFSIEPSHFTKNFAMPNLCQFTETYCVPFFFVILQTFYNAPLASIYRMLWCPTRACVNWKIFYNKKIITWENPCKCQPYKHHTGIL